MLTKEKTIESVIALYLKKLEHKLQSDRDSANDYPELYHRKLKDFAKVFDEREANRIGGEIWGRLYILGDGDEALMKALARQYYQDARALFLAKYPDIYLPEPELMMLPV